MDRWSSPQWFLSTAPAVVLTSPVVAWPWTKNCDWTFRSIWPPECSIPPSVATALSFWFDLRQIQIHSTFQSVSSHKGTNSVTARELPVNQHSEPFPAGLLLLIAVAMIIIIAAAKQVNLYLLIMRWNSVQQSQECISSPPGSQAIKGREAAF